MGMITGRHGTVSISNMILKNVTDILFHEPQFAQRTMPMSNLIFASLDGTAVAGRDSQRRNIVLEPFYDVEEQTLQDIFVLQDKITLDGKEIFFKEQRTDFIPYPSEANDDEEEEEDVLPVNPSYLGKTNQELWDEFSVALGGELLPGTAVEDSRIINGFIEP